MLLTPREVLVAGAAAALTLAAGSAVRSAPAVMTSAVFPWSAMTPVPTASGQVRQVFRTPTGTLDELECHVTTLAASQTTHAPHTHANEEVLIVRDGNVEVFFKNAWHPAAPGDVIFLTGTDPHGIRNTGAAAATYHVLSWHSPGMKKPAEGAK